MIIIIGTITVQPDQRDACVTASHALQALARAEPGCLAYVFAADPIEANLVTVHELWADAASLEAHFTQPSYVDMRAMLRTHGYVGSNTSKYRVDAVASVYNAQGIASATFD
jgi:quinol monooxygenase YgiN